MCGVMKSTAAAGAGACCSCGNGAAVTVADSTGTVTCARRGLGATAHISAAASQADRPLAAEANLHVAEARYAKGEYAEAIKSYTTAKKKAVPGEVAERAIPKCGWAQYRLEQCDTALAARAMQGLPGVAIGYGAVPT